MTISTHTVLSFLQKQVVMELWNNEYPYNLRYQNIEQFEMYLEKLQQPKHYFLLDGNIIRGWASTFKRNDETWFAVIVDGKIQGKGFGVKLLNRLKFDQPVLNGWVIDHSLSVKANGEIYNSPIHFYLKNNFKICSETRLETEKISAVKINWTK